jgi:hypothetical protein
MHSKCLQKSVYFIYQNGIANLPVTNQEFQREELGSKRTSKKLIADKVLASIESETKLF